MRPRNSLLFFLPSLAFADELKERVVKDIMFDKKEHTIAYTLTSPAHVRIRLDANDGPMFMNVLNWAKRDAGKHVEHYYGFDNSNAIFTFHFYTDDNADTYGLNLFEILPHPAQVIVGKALPAAQLNHMHKTHPREFCYDPKALARFDKVPVKNGEALIRGVTPLVIDLGQKDKSWFTRERFQVNIFLDNILLHQDFEGYVPYVWNFDPQGVNPGKHTIIVNLSSFKDHIATVVVPIEIAGKAK